MKYHLFNEYSIHLMSDQEGNVGWYDSLKIQYLPLLGKTHHLSMMPLPHI